jgi:hypothetical protein
VQDEPGEEPSERQMRELRSEAQKPREREDLLIVTAIRPKKQSIKIFD